MKILALEFSTPRRSVSVAVDGEVRSRAVEQGTRETRAFALIDRVLHEAALSRDEIECVAVGIGPGSYAGIRIAIAIASGWHLARGVSLLGIPSADAVALQAFQSGLRGCLNLVIDAQRNQFFRAQYVLDDLGWKLMQPFALMPASTNLMDGEMYFRFDIPEHPTERCLVPDASGVALLAAQNGSADVSSTLEPVYLRKAEFVKAPPMRTDLGL